MQFSPSHHQAHRWLARATGLNQLPMGAPVSQGTKAVLTLAQMVRVAAKPRSLREKCHWQSRRAASRRAMSKSIPGMDAAVTHLLVEPGTEAEVGGEKVQKEDR